MHRPFHEMDLIIIYAVIHLCIEVMAAQLTEYMIWDNMYAVLINKEFKSKWIVSNCQNIRSNKILAPKCLQSLRNIITFGNNPLKHKNIVWDHGDTKMYATCTELSLFFKLTVMG